MCRVNVTATLEDHSIHVEENDRPDSLLYAAEGEAPGLVERTAWNLYIRRHPEDPARALHLNLQPALPPGRLREVERGFVWLVRKIVGGPD